MTDRELIGKVHSAMYHQCQSRGYAEKSGLKPSFCYYKQWGVKKKNGQSHKPVIPLLFSKNGDPAIERWYATHFVDSKRIGQLKPGKKSKRNRLAFLRGSHNGCPSLILKMACPCILRAKEL